MYTLFISLRTIMKNTFTKIQTNIALNKNSSIIFLEERKLTLISSFQIFAIS